MNDDTQRPNISIGGDVIGGNINIGGEQNVYINQSPSPNLFTEYVRDAKETFSRLIEHRTDAHIFKEMDVRLDNTPQHVQLPKPRIDSMKTKMFMREGMQSFTDATVKEIEIGSVQEGMDKLHGRLLLLGDPGAGKTFTLYRYAYKSLEERLDNPSGTPLPIYLICSTWQEGQTLIQWIHDQWQSLERLRESDLQNALLLLDGFDELGTSRIRKVKDKDGNPVKDKDGKEREESYDPRPPFLKIIPKEGAVLLSCRIKEYEDFGTKVELNGAVTLRPLTETQIHEYLADLPDLWDALSSDAELLEVMKTPLLLSLFAFGYKDAPDEAKALQDLNVAELSEAIFKQYVHKRYEHEALRLKDMGQAPPFTLDKVYDVLGQIAMVNASGGWRVKDNVLTVDDFQKVLKTKARLQRFIAFTSLINLITPIEDAFRFIHLRLRDHFVRAYCYPRVGDEQFYSDYKPTPAKALACLPNAEAVDALAAQLNHTSLTVRREVVEVLGKIGDARAVEPLITALKDKDANVRLSVMRALVKIGDECAVEPLIAAFKDAHAVEPLIAALKDVDWEVRRYAPRTLGKIGDPRAVEPLIATLKDNYKWVGNNAAEALGKIGDPRAVEPLIAALKDADENMRRCAAEALVRIGRPAIGPLIVALKDADVSVRRRAAEALGKIGEVRAVEPLITALRDADGEVRRHAVEALGEIGDAHAVEPLIAAHKANNWWTRGSAQLALQRIGTPEALAALEAWRKRQRGE